jgi:hypothetical protein
MFLGRYVGSALGGLKIANSNTVEAQPSCESQLTKLSVDIMPTFEILTLGDEGIYISVNAM